MRQLWAFNMRFPQSEPIEPITRKRKAENPEKWAGYRTRQMLQLLYTISMLCLLRYDEALRIMWTDLEPAVMNGVHCLRLNLPFRKTAQYGGKYGVQLFLLPVPLIWVTSVRDRTVLSLP